ncbi:nitroimidazol reductase NimA-like FMN-containing flavoprotein (pyridoxamine 5'-phosphate oxidase superfamily) [Microlunatus panaciterrae]|uniref:Nitroimidazol reductase NimA-like FMN-containing flavoprotein (Pyridoxamine 5'-phosphate oxidase superfamily) n=1 Tax=Microlunatus panaciterrae TaxID=400768 RepID=A0ABS2RDN9_9ACTN|nr:pyridoxamine 5'-phosphate oxidase family protein [Microlunatus panaciterrae]MBM7797121.1 nitroimidazol reductase NimA-like FMN-containing flavoprotein (pyridoxamine 5'-phosphate oxidase superfamily) [Microlunatus panaciterrae]
MTTSPKAWWEKLARGAHLDELTRRECLELLGAKHVGRLAYNGPNGPRVVPMNYVVTDLSLIFRTDPEREPGRYSRARMVAFEVDEIDEFFHGGWSVLVTGLAEPVTVEELRALTIEETPDPWPEGLRDLFLQIPLADLSGRRVLPS